MLASIYIFSLFCQKEKTKKRREMGITKLDGRKYNINFVACDEELA
jgi:hypothetical protein